MTGMGIAWKDHPLLHVFGQSQWHTPLMVLGNEKGLRALRDACDAAINKGSAKQAKQDATQNDGEGYQILAVMVDDPETDALPVAYDDTIASAKHFKFPPSVSKSLDELEH